MIRIYEIQLEYMYVTFEGGGETFLSKSRNLIG